LLEGIIIEVLSKGSYCGKTSSYSPTLKNTSSSVVTPIPYCFIPKDSFLSSMSLKNDSNLLTSPFGS